jgi:hypothetical protein
MNRHGDYHTCCCRVASSVEVDLLFPDVSLAQPDVVHLDKAENAQYLEANYWQVTHP